MWNKACSPIVLILILFALLSTSGCDYYIVKSHDNNVGHINSINADKSGDFHICYEEKIFTPYWRRSPARFSQGKKALKSFVLDHYDHNGYTHQSGYITIRFIVNCKGEPGMYIVQETGTDYRKKKFDGELGKTLLNITMGLKEWAPLTIFGDAYDSYVYLTYKIENGKIVEILP